MKKKYIRNNHGKEHTKKSNRLNPTILLRIYRMMLRNPLKVFVRKDFATSENSIPISYLKTLCGLDLVEVVPAICRFGRKYRGRREVLGFKIKR
jgi:hypothetical protein